ncbi:hypothetical protein [Streptomyces cyaneus]|uniref:hypothetical protein n=1 Tax=Streptomyces cyaneus TaxID=1904 RepID=UPI001FEAA9EE|nr:hypothetical protein [Streptomyces cyaneus]
MTTHEKIPENQNQNQSQEQPQPQPPRSHLSAAGLRARGWTPGMVRQLLGEPDLLRVNPHFHSAPQTRLYSVERVEATERSEEFRAASAVAARRSAAARAAALRMRREVLARIAAEPIDVPLLAPDRLAALAVEHRNRLDGERALWRWRHVATPTTVDSAEPCALDRWKVDYLRHRLTRYDEILDELYGRTGRAAAEELLQRRVYAAISKAYPHLAQECERQLRERECGQSPE